MPYGSSVTKPAPRSAPSVEPMPPITIIAMNSIVTTNENAAPDADPRNDRRRHAHPRVEAPARLVLAGHVEDYEVHGQRPERQIEPFEPQRGDTNEDPKQRTDHRGGR